MGGKSAWRHHAVQPVPAAPTGRPTIRSRTIYGSVGAVNGPSIVKTAGMPEQLTTIEMMP
jgi:hypothetical protein